MRDTVVRFGTFAGIDANGQGKADNAAFWNSITSAPAWAQRDAWVDIREIPNVGSPGGDTLSAIATAFGRDEMQRMWRRTKFCLINNCELEVVDPIKGGTGSVAVVGTTTLGVDDDAAVWNHTTKPQNARWKMALLANAYPNIRCRSS